MTKSTGPTLSLEEMGQMAKKLRRHVLTMTSRVGSGHPGGSLSAADILTALFFKVLRYRPYDPHWPDRDRFILSKGHAAPVLYAALAESGYFPVEELSTLRRLDSRLQGHVDSTATPGAEMSSGSLAMGLSFGIGMALAARMDGREHRIYVLLGDGECEAGQVWEAVMAAAHYKLDNLVAIVDHNKLQLTGWNRDVMNVEPLAPRWGSFGWHTIEINGHNLKQILRAVEEAKGVKGQPTVIVAHTIKGKGVSFMENKAEFHGRALTPEELERALEELA
ncbi:MAG: transketolase [Dehalococcoidia bacterium]